MADNSTISSIHKQADKGFVRQKDQSDCGVACLASVMHFYDSEAKLERLREMSGTNQQGTTLLGLYQAAGEIGLDAQAFEGDLENLKKLEHPAILHIVKDKRLQHYVVYYGCEGNQLLIGDPAEGTVQWMPEEKLQEQWQSKALLVLKPTEQLVVKRERDKDRWNWIKRLVKEDVQILGLALALGIFITALSLSTAIFSQTLIDDILPDRDVTRLFIGVAFLGFLLLAQSGLIYIRRLFLIRQSRDFNNRVINNFYDALLQLPVPFFFNRKTGDLIARMNDTRRLQQTVTYLFADVMIDVLMIIVASGYIFYHSGLLGGFVLLSVPLYFLLTWYFHDSILDGQKKVMAAHSANESNYVDTIQGIATIKTGNRQSFFSNLTKTVYGFFQDQIFDLGKIGIHFSFWANIIEVVFTVCVLLFGAMLVLSGDIMIGVLVAVFQMTNQLMPSANRLALTNIQIQEARVAFDRMYEFTSLDPEGEIKEEVQSLKEFNRLEVKGLSFRFPGRSQLLQNVTFSVEKGEMIALLGESGCGKTTLLQILQRFYKPEQGKIIANNGLEMEDLSLESWRGHMAAVSQQVKIFNGSLLDNICLGNAEDAEKVVAFCKEFGFSKYFENFPQQYGTLLGEEGVNISGGQQQLVALARALYQKPDLLLLDEATSAMDRDTEQEMLKMLMKRREEMGIILVTHRVQSAKLANRIYIIEKGKITSQGAPQELVHQENLFSASLADISI
ncbi:peptidase domain-containing ABC transporter [Gracilimonas mengyeensis]|uniref:ATP-binding cassette, subfamily B n=1 Tax=Gracilimonas mengyeensis TaxID=1302730 RepID=A0A521DBW6_9BACT|nr:peptidase domain-containing ABC transporter [Gracilimonas mengyeensis]SMO69199.1 ATP-binding cassette, subfamily B [Gracilimonas mengyeensis]